MAEYRRSEIVSGLFILLAVVAFALMAFQVGGMGMPSFLKGNTVEFVTYFQDVKTLENGYKVTVGGKQVGSVTDIKFAKASDVVDFWRASGVGEDERPAFAKKDKIDRQMMRVEFEFDSGTDVLIDVKSAKVSLVQDGFLGTHFLTVDPGPRAAAVAATTLPEPIAIVPVSGAGLDGLIEDGRNLLAEASDLLRSLKSGLLTQENYARVSSILSELDASVKQAHVFLGELPKYVDPTKTGSIDQKIIDPVNKLITNANDIVSKLWKHLEEETLKEADKLLRDGQLTLADARKALATVDNLITTNEPNITKTIASLRETVGSLQGRLDAIQADVQKLLTNTDGLVTDARGILAENKTELNEILQGLRRTMWDAEVLVRKLRANPAVAIWGDDEPVLNPHPVDETQLRQSGRARSYGQREESDGGKK